MSIVTSLLQAIVRVDGDALVMHAGDKPYVVSPTGQTELASRGLTLEAVNGVVAQLLPIELQNALDEFGAVQHELAPMAEFPGEHFTVVAARGGDDVWTEIRRRRIPEDDLVPAAFFAGATAPPVAPAPVPLFAAPSRQAPGVIEDLEMPPVETLGFNTPSADAIVEQGSEYTQALEEEEVVINLDDDLAPPDVGHLWPGQSDGERFVDDDDVAPLAPVFVMPAPPVRMPPPAPVAVLPAPAAPHLVAPKTPVMAAPVAPVVPPAAIAPVIAPQPPVVVAAPPPRPVAPPKPAPVAPPVAASIEPPRVVPPQVLVPPPPPQPAVVLNLSRHPVRPDVPPPPFEDPTLSGLERLLRVSSARGASTLYLASESRPSVRVDGELQILEGEPAHTSRDVESLLLTLMPERSHEALRTGAATEWICDIEGVGRVRCMSFRDQRGPGGVFRLMPTRSVSADQIGLPKQVQALAIEPEGLILVAGLRSSGKRTTMAAFVDLMNRTRKDHIITIEREINIRHDRGSSFISQREVRGNDDDMLAAARAALREDPDVLVIEDLRTGPLMNVALEAAAAGRLVLGGFSAHTATAAIDRIIDLYAPEYRRQVQMALSDSLRGVVAQVLLKKIGGGRLPAREVLLNTPAVSAVIADGKTSQLPMAIEGGRRYGMMPMNDALVGLVHSGAVAGRDAYRHSPDRQGFVEALTRNGLDTSFAERFA